MLPSQRVELKKVELRGAIAAFPDDGDPDDLAKLNAEYRKADTQFASAIIVEQADAAAARATGDLNVEQRELDAIAPNVQFSEYVSAAVEMRSAAGAAGEYNSGHGMGGRQFPLAMLAPTQMRATTDVNGQASQSSRWLDRLFAESAAMRLGITMESVPAGQSAYLTTTAGASGSQRSRSQAIGDAVWAVGVATLEPKRNGVRAVYNIEDAARLPGLADSLRRDLGMAMTDAIDIAMFTGDAGATTAADDIAGLNTYSGLAEQEITQANKILGPGTLAAFTGLVDGLHAMDLADLNIVASVGAWRLWANTVINSAADNQTLAQFLMASGLSWGSRANIETDTADGDFGAFVGRSRGMAGAGVAAVWNAGQMIVDEITGAAEGEVRLTLNYLWNWTLPRASNFARVKFVA